MRSTPSAATSPWPRIVSAGAGQRRTKVKIYRVARTDGRVVFQVSDYSSGSRRLRNFADEFAALAEARRLADCLARGDASAASMDAGDRAALARAQAHLAPHGVSVELAAATIGECLREVGTPARLLEAARSYARRQPLNLPSVPVRQAVEAFIAHHQKIGSSQRYVADMRSRLLHRFARDFAVPVAALAGPDLKRWLDALPQSPQSRLNCHRLLSAWLGWSREQGWLVEHPLAGITPPRVRHAGDPTIFSPAELAALLRAADSAFLPSLALQAFAGLRSAEVERLTWDEISFATRSVLLRSAKSKTGARRVVPMSDALVAWLSLTPEAGRCNRVWKGLPDAFYAAQAATAARAGVAWKRNALRHTFASARLAVSGDAARTALELGNSAQVVDQHYRALMTEAQGLAWFAVLPVTPANVLPLPAAPKSRRRPARAAALRA